MLSAAVIIDNGRPFQRYISIRQAAAVVGSLHSVAVYWYYRNWGIFMPPPQGGIKRYRDPSVCLSHGAAALGYRHAGCLQLSQVRTADPSVDGRLSTASRTAIGGGHIVSPPPGR